MSLIDFITLILSLFYIAILINIILADIFLEEISNNFIPYLSHYISK